MPTTPNYGWDTPADTDYVTNGALAIRTMANDADATVYSVQTTLDAEKVDKAGDTMTGYLVIPTITAQAKALGIAADAAGEGILQFINQAVSSETGSIKVSGNTLIEISVLSNGNSLSFNNLGETNRTHNGEIRPMPFAIEAGYQTSIAAGSTASISLNSGRFLEIPIVLITPVSNTATVKTCHVGNLTTSGFTIYNTSAVTINVFWEAIQMYSASAAG